MQEALAFALFEVWLSDLAQSVIRCKGHAGCFEVCLIGVEVSRSGAFSAQLQAVPVPYDLTPTYKVVHNWSCVVLIYITCTAAGCSCRPTT